MTSGRCRCFLLLCGVGVFCYFFLSQSESPENPLLVLCLEAKVQIASFQGIEEGMEGEREPRHSVNTHFLKILIWRIVTPSTVSLSSSLEILCFILKRVSLSRLRCSHRVQDKIEPLYSFPSCQLSSSVRNPLNALPPLLCFLDFKVLLLFSSFSPVLFLWVYE